MLSKFICLAAWIRKSFKGWIISPRMYATVDLFVCWWTLGLLLILTIADSVAVSPGVQIPVWVPAFSSLGNILRIADYWVMFCSVSWDCPSLSYNVCTILHSHHQCVRVLVCPHPLQPLVFPFFFLFGSSSSNGYEVTYSVDLICIPLITSNVKHLFMSSWSVVYLWRDVFSGPLPTFVTMFIY